MNDKKYRMPYLPESGDCDQDFKFLDKGFDFLVATEEEAIESLERLLTKRKTLSSIELEEENITPQIIAKAINKGTAIFNKLTYPAQLTLNF